MITTHFYAQDAQGNILPGADVFVYLTGTTTLATGLQTALGVALANPFKASATGQIQFKAPDGNYDIRVKSGPRESTLRGVQVFDGILKFADLESATNPLLGAGIVGRKRATLSAPIKNVNQALDAQSVSIWEFAALAGGYSVGGNPLTWDWSPALTAAIAASPDPAHPYDIDLGPGEKIFNSTVVLPTNAPIRIFGSGSRSQRAATGSGCSVINFQGTGFAFTYNVGAGSVGFRGCHIERLHIKGTPAAQGGIWLGNVANCILRDVTVSDIMRADLTGTGFKLGDAGTIGAQYNTLDNCCASSVDIGIDNVNTNGLRIIGGLYEDLTAAPRAGTIGILFRAGGEGAIIGAVIQGWDTLLDLAGEFISCSAVRCEGFITAAYKIKGRSNNVVGGSISNFIAGGGGTGIIVGPLAINTMLVVPDITSTTATIVDPSALSTIVGHERLSAHSGLFRPFSTNRNGLAVQTIAGQTSPLFAVLDAAGAPLSYIDATFETVMYFPGFGTRRVSLGLPDSADPGHRTLRVPN